MRISASVNRWCGRSGSVIKSTQRPNYKIIILKCDLNGMERRASVCDECECKQINLHGAVCVVIIPDKLLETQILFDESRNSDDII